MSEIGNFSPNSLGISLDEPVPAKPGLSDGANLQTLLRILGRNQKSLLILQQESIRPVDADAVYLRRKRRSFSCIYLLVSLYSRHLI